LTKLKLDLGAKTATGAKLRRRFCSFFLRGPKSQLWESYGAKTAIKPSIYPLKMCRIFYFVIYVKVSIILMLMFVD